MDVLELPSMGSMPLDLALPSPWDSDRVMAEAVFGPCSGDAGAQRRGVSGCVIIITGHPLTLSLGVAPQTALQRQEIFTKKALRRDLKR